MIKAMEPRLTKDEKKVLRQEDTRQKMEAEQKRSFWKKVALWSAAGLLVVLGLWALVIFSTGSSSPTASIKLPPLTKTDYQSNPTAPVTLVEYADFQCPACKAYYPLIKQLQSDFGSKLNVVYRFFPLKTIHQNAINTAKAAYAAGLQGKFWQMHDKLFETQDTWATLPDPEPTLLSYAKDLGLDAAQFKKDYEAGSTLVVVNTAYDADVAMGLNSTPTFFLQGKQILNNPQSYSDFKALIAKYLK